MAHFRKQLRDGTKARLTAGLDGRAAVFAGRITPIRDAECPAVNILTFGDDLDDERASTSRQLRTSPLAIQIIVSGRRDESQDDADQIAEVVEGLMQPGPEWSLPVRSLEYGGTSVDVAQGADGALISTTLQYFAGVVVPAGKPGEPLIAANPQR